MQHGLVEAARRQDASDGDAERVAEHGCTCRTHTHTHTLEILQVNKVHRSRCQEEEEISKLVNKLLSGSEVISHRPIAIVAHPE